MAQAARDVPREQAEVYLVGRPMQLASKNAVTAVTDGSASIRADFRVTAMPVTLVTAVTPHPYWRASQ